MKLFAKYLRRRDWLAVLAALALIAGQVWLDLRLPEYMAQITRLLETPGSTMGQLLEAGGWMLLCALGSLVSSIAVGYLAARLAAGFSMHLREGIYDRVMSFSMAEINRFSTASLITRSTNDINQLQMLVSMGLQVMVKAPIMGVMAVVKISGKSWQWTALTAGAIGVIVLFALFMVLYALPKFRQVQAQTDELNRVTREHLTGLAVVRAYNAEAVQEAKFNRANKTLTDTNLKAGLAMMGLSPVMNLVMNGLSLGIYWIGAYLLQAIPATDMAQRLSVFSEMVVFMSYAMQIVMAFLMLVMIFVMLPRAAVSARRIQEVLDTEATVQDGPQTAGAAGLRGRIEFRDVSFRYPGAAGDMLRHVSFTANPGETVAIIGATGSGKSTLLNLIPRFYDTTGGTVLVDGVDVRDYRKDALHAKLGYVPQRSWLFTGTVAQTLSFGCEGAPEAQLHAALETAQAADFIDAGAGMQGQVAQGGSNFSGGQRQRLAIARAVAVRPEIYLFDDSFSALDYQTDRALRSALRAQTDGATTIIVAQRIGTIRDADRIIVLDEGRAVGIGTHAELMANCEVYREIALSQLSEEELSA